MLLLEDGRLLCDENWLVRVAGSGFRTPSHMLRGSSFHLVHHFLVVLLIIGDHNGPGILLALKCCELRATKLAPLRLCHPGQIRLVSILWKPLRARVSHCLSLHLRRVGTGSRVLSARW